MIFKVATWNVNSIRARQDHVVRWLADVSPDILALQEIKVINENFPIEAFRTLGYHVVCSGQKSYNGVALLTRAPAQEIVCDLPQLADGQRRILAATVQGIRVVNVYVPNGAAVDSEQYTYKLRFLDALHHFLEQQLADYAQVIVLGDFNIAPQDIDVHDPVRWQGGLLVSDPERKSLYQLRELGFVDTFRVKSAETGFTWWDYRQGAFRRDWGLRIDLILCSASLQTQLSSSAVDRTPRTWYKPSDHAPVIAAFHRAEC